MKILMLTSSFDIGGAETHILELSKALTEKGHYVAVASSGGDYVRELNRYEIPHISLPLNSKNPAKMYFSYRNLKKAIMEKGFDVIHAHARLPALIGSFLSKQTKVPMVTTAHWVFSLKQPAKMLTRWGSKTLSVSADIKKYLIDNYKIYPDNIKTTVNGIDTSAFKSVKKEFSSNRIIHISRLDEGRSRTAFALIAIAPLLSKKYNNLRIDIIGSGNCEEKIRQEAIKANQTYGHEVIKLLGKRTDIAALLSNEKCIFVGVSRAALEAMACEYPVILSGDEGYEGIFIPEESKKSIMANFCCRNAECLCEKNLIQDIETLFNDEEYSISIGKRNRDFVKSRYSLHKMAEDAESVYNSVIKFENSPKVIICGYYGYGNIGDEATLEETVKELRREKISDITVLSKTPKDTSRKIGVNAVHRYNFPKINSLLKKCDIFMLGGGNLLQNQTSNRSLLYYGKLLELAKKHNVKCYCHSCGIGELYGDKWKSFVKKILLCCESVMVRTEKDAETISDISAEIKVKHSCDIVFLKEYEKEDYFLTKFSDLENRKYALFALREPRSNRKTFIECLSSAIKTSCQKEKILPVFITMQKDKDKKITLDIISKSETGNIKEVSSASEILFLLKNAEFACGMRMHFMILSLIAGVPFISISYDAKCKNIYEELTKYRKSNFLFKEISDSNFEFVFSEFLNELKTKEGNRDYICVKIPKKRAKFLFTLENNE